MIRFSFLTRFPFPLQYVLGEAQEIKRTAHWEVNVEVEVFEAKSGANRLVSGLFSGKTLVYSDLKHIILRILPKYASDQAADNAILVSSHIDTVFSTYAFFVFLILILNIIAIYISSHLLSITLITFFPVAFFSHKDALRVSGEGLEIAVHVWELCWSLLEGFLSGLTDSRILSYFYLIPGRRRV